MTLEALYTLATGASTPYERWSKRDVVNCGGEAVESYRNLPKNNKNEAKTWRDGNAAAISILRQIMFSQWYF